jgi:preprotein translocase subunit SecB
VTSLEKSKKCAEAKFKVMLQYLRDLKFYYSNNESLFTKLEQKQLDGKPEIMAQVNVVGHLLRGDIFESVLELKITASVNGKEVYTANLQYATVVTLIDADSYTDDERQYITTVIVGSFAFPFARCILFNITRDSGSTPISLDPIDFAQMYAESQKKKAEARAELDPDVESN